MPDEIRKTAASIFGVPESDVTPDMRARAKTASYMQHYAASDAAATAALWEYWYRYYEERTTSGVKVYLSSYRVVKRTPKGVWIQADGFDMPRFILRDARKRYACPTKEEALESFKRRKKRQIAILTGQFDRAKQALRVAEDYPKLIHELTSNWIKDA